MRHVSGFVLAHPVTSNPKGMQTSTTVTLKDSSMRCGAYSISQCQINENAQADLKADPQAVLGSLSGF